MVRSSLLFLVVGATLGTVMMGAKALARVPAWAAFLPAHREMLVVGWLVQLAAGVAYWILPPLKKAAIRERNALATWGLLNAGVLLVAVASLTDGAAGMTICGRAAEALAVLTLGASFLQGHAR